MAEALTDWSPVSSLVVFLVLVGGWYHWYSTKKALLGMAGRVLCKKVVLIAKSLWIVKQRLCPGKTRP